jgi:8-oxo-dGTP pyrophosphatase MutT (NUDIX family)
LAKSIIIDPSKNITKVSQLVNDKHQVAATIGFFVGLVRWIGEKPEILVRRRTAKDSLYDVDLSGKNEAIGGAQSFADLTNGYYSSIAATIVREAREEAGLALSNWRKEVGLTESPYVLIPAQLSKEDGTNDLALIMPTRFYDSQRTSVYEEKLKSGAVSWLTADDLQNLTVPIISLRTRVMLWQALRYVELDSVIHLL